MRPSPRCGRRPSTHWPRCTASLGASTCADWEAPRGLADEIERWRPILAKGPEPGWIVQGEALCQRLLATRPDGEPLGLIHGDMQPGNALFDDGRLTGFIDWELAGIGSRRLDAGWLMLMADAESWPADWRPVCPLTPQQIAARYAQRMGEPVGDLAWYQALAGLAARRDHLPQRASAPQRAAARRGLGALRRGGEPDVLARTAHPRRLGDPRRRLTMIDFSLPAECSTA